jgi:hypothetical protein
MIDQRSQSNIHEYSTLTSHKIEFACETLCTVNNCVQDRRMGEIFSLPFQHQQKKLNYCFKQIMHKELCIGNAFLFIHEPDDYK